MKLLFITQKIHQKDDDLAFVILWIKEFIRQGAEVEVICLEKREFDDSFPVHSLGKEKGFGKLSQVLEFWKLIFTLKYDRVFVHMNAEYMTLGGWYWFLRGIPTYLWFTHYVTHIHLKLAGFFCQRLFAATSQSLPQYEGNPKKIITGHGIDTDFWMSAAILGGVNNNDEHHLCSIHRLCRSKRLELGIRALKNLPADYNLTVYGRDVEKDYYQEILALIKKEHLEERAILKGPVAMENLKNIYSQFRLMVNMASETIDKTMLEAMLFGIYPITTPANSRAIGLPIWPLGETPADLAKFILDGEWKKYSQEYLQNIVKEKHSLSSLIAKMNVYIKSGS
ncbi:MAG: hypothetical protein UT86_C0001G0017 [Candidatus Magasanikbacteria bacterium GW2011_GWC2_40_17]|uniref:Glycosyltransferase n=1 Tax=Candidatus Magasanikbacteria bacterium GW2011_GWA2_42_32 TaxID=1619039 RepID=A0A0G1A8K5_9BACT|nr:MAG: hypothetical protein UT86_C0001G0017 [Candidatus Magasanikbacteria bacterium GW2011_GWC2_40_17]KKS57377.1 MAG: hypothetical protein UV20_C0001G0017 [Candidatus Magasanikbacteria bacterium GW2011_GWA2_42_32]